MDRSPGASRFAAAFRLADSPTLRHEPAYPPNSQRLSPYKLTNLNQDLTVPSWNRLSGMTTKDGWIREEVRYSEAFKMGVVRELEAGQLTYQETSRRYGIKGRMTVAKWVRKYGNGTRGKVIRVQRPDEIDQLKQLKERVRRLETALADANVDLALERAYMRIACRRAGIEDVDGFKKKVAGKPGMRL
jgi:transposase